MRGEAKVTAAHQHPRPDTIPSPSPGEKAYKPSHRASSVTEATAPSKKRSSNATQSIFRWSALARTSLVCRTWTLAVRYTVLYKLLPEATAMSVSSALSSLLYGCFYPLSGRHHHHRAGAYYHSSHPTSADSLYYNQGGLAGGRRMGRSRPLSLQVINSSALFLLPACSSSSSVLVFACSVMIFFSR